MTPALDTSCNASAPTSQVTTSYESSHDELLFGINSHRIPNDTDACTISATSSPQDPNYLNAFFQSIVHNSSTIFQPQPLLATSYHQLLDLPHVATPLPGSFGHASGGSFPSVCASPQSSSHLDNDSWRAAQFPFGFLPLGVAGPHANVEPLPSNASTYHLTSYTNGITQSVTAGEIFDPTPGPSTSASAPPDAFLPRSSAESNTESSLSPPGNELVTQVVEELDSTQPTQIPGVELDRAFSSCALVDGPSKMECAIEQQFSPTHSNKRSRSATLTSDVQSQPKHPTCSEVKVVDALNEMGTADMAKLTKPASKIRAKDRKLRREKVCAQRARASHSGQQITPSRPNVLSNKKIYRNILPPTPDSLQRPGSHLHDLPADSDRAAPADRKRRKIESMEKALEALDTLTEYLSKEATECRFNGSDPTDNRDQMSAQEYHCHINLPLVSPQHFFTLGELGGRLRRRLDVERR